MFGSFGWCFSIVVFYFKDKSTWFNMNIGAGPAIGNACSIDATDLNQKDNENSSNTGTTDQGRESNVSQNIHSTQVCSTAMQQGMNSSFPGYIHTKLHQLHLSK